VPVTMPNDVTTRTCGYSLSRFCPALRVAICDAAKEPRPTRGGKRLPIQRRNDRSLPEGKSRSPNQSRRLGATALRATLIHPEPEHPTDSAGSRAQGFFFADFHAPWRGAADDDPFALCDMSRRPRGTPRCAGQMSSIHRGRRPHTAIGLLHAAVAEA
jgi:hypothetical protein